MFDKLKALNKARQMQNEIKKQLEQIFHEESKSDHLVLLRGDKKIEKIVIDGQERKDIKDLMNGALKELDKKVEKKMRDQAGGVMEMLGM
jgi:DNA-binding protein YbaB